MLRLHAMKVLGLDEAVGPWPMLYSFWPLDRRPVSSCLTRRVRPGTGYHKTPHSRRRVVSRIETSLRTTAHQLLTLSSTKESGCMHSLSVYCRYKVYGRPPASGQGAPTSNVLAPQCPPGSTSQRKRRTSSSPHVRSRKTGSSALGHSSAGWFALEL